jgi:hypothetical protein
MTIDAELQRHRADWIGFTRFVKYGTIIVILLVVLLALITL